MSQPKKIFGTDGVRGIANVEPVTAETALKLGRAAAHVFKNLEREARDLPWRKRRMRNGYGALVAEMMLQQTQVSRVIERYQRFMRQFPDVASLAAADEQKVLSLWQGLGYYRRARNLHAAAKMIARDFAGRVPRTARDLMLLPGVGRYTAGAVASLVFGQAEPIVDGNIRRVMARLPRKKAAHMGGLLMCCGCCTGRVAGCSGPRRQ